MAKEKEKPAAEGKSEGGGKKRKLHLHEVRSTQAHDGSIVHHHTYKEHKDAPSRCRNAGQLPASATPEEAGHCRRTICQNQGGGQEPAAGGEPEPGAGGAMQPGA